MICVIIGRTRHKHMLAEHQFLAEQGVKLVELRVDYIGRAPSLSRLLTNRPTPVIVTARRRDDGGRWMRSEEERQMLLRTAIVSGVEYVDLEADIAGSIPRYGTTKRIVSYHNFVDTPDNLEDLHEAMAGEDADIVKIATMANSFRDNVRMLNLVKNAKVPTIGICMGEIGMMTRILASRVGSPFTYATMTAEKKVAPGQLTYKQMNEMYHFDQINPQTELFGVVADPVAHSHSPLIHNRAMVEANLNARYLPFRVPKDDLHHFLDACPELGIHGISITIPHKENALTYCTQAESSATGIGAINTMVFDGDDRLGYNTDYRAAMDCITEAYKSSQGGEARLNGLRTLVLGSGGVSRAVAWGLKQRGADVTFSGRNAEKSSVLASELLCRSIPWEQRHEVKPQLLVNGTPVGMHPNVDSSPFAKEHLNNLMVVFDTVYNPENTLLVKQAREARARVITGVDMFVRQAAYQFKLFTGRDASAAPMRATIKEATNPVRLNP